MSLYAYLTVLFIIIGIYVFYKREEYGRDLIRVREKPMAVINIKQQEI